MTTRILFGTAAAIKRYQRYEPFVTWVFHSNYKGLAIERAFEGPQPKACYRALDPVSVSDERIITGEGLSQVKAAITRFIAEGC